ncbi:FAD-binding oxidoreductase [Micromonospora sp. 067-2]|uniref:FAD-binding oxidoreductase n=1 Tax=Micromonospora sp. 067-2 TaxID=2789270 RepID=UPI00397B8BDC
MAVPDEGSATALARELSGRVFRPGDPRYDDLRKPWLQVVDQHPKVIVDAASVSDVVTAVTYARTQRIPLSVMATGHGIVGPCDDGLLLRLSAMRNISVDTANRTATFGPGVTSGDLLGAVEPEGLAYPLGQVTSVGVTAFSLGGGLGWLVRHLGSAASHVLAVQLVLADGTVTRADETQNADLFWALRGGGGNFGVVVSLTMALRPIPEVVGGELYFPIERAADVLRFYRDWAAGLPTTTSTVCRLLAAPPEDSVPAQIRGRTVCMFGLCHADPATSDAILAPLRGLGTPLLDSVRRQRLSDVANLDPASHAAGSPTYSHVEYLSSLSDEVIDGLVRIAHTTMPPLMQLEVQQLGGALADEVGAHQAFTAPSAPFLLHAVTPAVTAPMDQIAAATTDAFASLGDVYTGEAYFNFLRGDQQDRVGDAFGADTFRRLREIKATYDPDNMFRFTLNVPPT